jgi:hypothetical protein
VGDSIRKARENLRKGSYRAISLWTSFSKQQKPRISTRNRAQIYTANALARRATPTIHPYPLWHRAEIRATANFRSLRPLSLPFSARPPLRPRAPLRISAKPPHGAAALAGVRAAIAEARPCGFKAEGTRADLALRRIFRGCGLTRRSAELVHGRYAALQPFMELAVLIA